MDPVRQQNGPHLSPGLTDGYGTGGPGVAAGKPCQETGTAVQLSAAANIVVVDTVRVEGSAGGRFLSF